MADFYLEPGASFVKVGKKFGMKPDTAYYILTKACGGDWMQTFNSNLLNIHKIVPTKIPPILSDKVIKAIKERAKDRRTNEFKTQAYPYLLSGVLFDEASGKPLPEQQPMDSLIIGWPMSGVLAYGPKKLILTFGKVVEFISSSTRFHKAIFEGKPDQGRRDLEKKVEELEKDLKSVKKRKGNLLECIEAYDGNAFGSFLDSLKKKIAKVEAKEKDLNFQFQAAQNQLRTFPTKQKVETKRKMYAELLQRTKENIIRSGLPLDRLPIEQKKKLLRLLFQGKDPDGRKYGIFIKIMKGKANSRRASFRIYGRLGEVEVVKKVILDDDPTFGDRLAIDY